MDTAEEMRNLQDVARAVSEAAAPVAVVVDHDGKLAVAGFDFSRTTTLCVLRPGLPESQAKSAIYYQMLERKRMSHGEAVPEAQAQTRQRA